MATKKKEKKAPPKAKPPKTKANPRGKRKVTKPVEAEKESDVAQSGEGDYASH